MSTDPEAHPLKRFAFSLIKQTGSLLCCRESRPSAGMPAVAVGACVTGIFLICLLPAPHRQPLSKVDKGHVRRRQARPQALPWAAASMGCMCRPQSPQPGRGRPVPTGVWRPACVSEHTACAPCPCGPHPSEGRTDKAQARQQREQVDMGGGGQVLGG